MATNEDENENDDPFACFDSSDDDDDGQDERREEEQEHEHARDPGNGVLAFHAGTEVALLHYVKTELAKKRAVLGSNCNNETVQQERTDSICQSSTTTIIIEQAKTVLQLVDSYCLSRHWMMHVGPDKAGPLQDFISQCIWKQRQKCREECTKQETKNDNKTVTVVELGTYCGYSSIFIAKTILEYYIAEADNTEIYDTKSSNNDKDNPLFHIYSVEVVDGFVRVANELIRLAGMEAYVTVILAKDPDDPTITAGGGKRRGEANTDSESSSSSLSSELGQRLPRSKDNGDETETATVDFLFVDHDKSMYLPHLKELESAGFIREGTHVAADNVIFAQIDDYRGYMSQLAEKGVVETRLEDSLLVEYCQPELAMQVRVRSSESQHSNGEIATIEKDATATTKDMLRDGIEFSVYLTDPIMS